MEQTGRGFGFDSYLPLFVAAKGELLLDRKRRGNLATYRHRHLPRFP